MVGRRRLVRSGRRCRSRRRGGRARRQRSSLVRAGRAGGPPACVRRVRRARSRWSRPPIAPLERATSDARSDRRANAADLHHTRHRRRRRADDGNPRERVRGHHCQAKRLDLPARSASHVVGEGEAPLRAGDGGGRLSDRGGQPLGVVRVIARRRVRQRCPEIRRRSRNRVQRPGTAGLADLVGRAREPRVPIRPAPKLPRNKARWVDPDLVAQVSFANWTLGGSIRHPVYLGLREDKLASEVVREP